jgi:hypothetical protein
MDTKNEEKVTVIERKRIRKERVNEKQRWIEIKKKEM